MSSVSGWEMFARYAFPPNELGYCGPPDASVLLPGRGGGSAVARHARGFEGAWPYLQELAAAAGHADALDLDVVRNYWVGGPLLRRTDRARLVRRLHAGLPGQPTGLLDTLADSTEIPAHHSFHVLAVYPWVRFLDGDPATPLRILQSCRIRWGTVDSVDATHATICAAPLLFTDGTLRLGAPTPERVRWSRDGTSLAPRPRPGQTVAAHWDWICGPLDLDERRALAEATHATLDLVNAARLARPPSLPA